MRLARMCTQLASFRIQPSSQLIATDLDELRVADEGLQQFQ